jgi:hypothetical protein
MANCRIGPLPLGRRKIHSSRSLRPPPIPLPNIKRTPNRPRIHLSTLPIHNILLLLDHASCFPLIVDPDNLGSQLEFATRGGRRQRFQEFDEPLAVYYARGVEFRDAGDGDSAFGGVEIYYFLRGLFEGCKVLDRGGIGREGGSRTEDYGVGWEDGEVGVEFLDRVSYGFNGWCIRFGTYKEKVKLIVRASNAVCEQQDVSLQP